MANSICPDFITLLVRDLDASHRFYSEIVGLKDWPERQPNAVAFSTQPYGFAIRKSPEGFDHASMPGSGVIIWFRTDDATALHDSLKARHVVITEGVADSPFGKTFTFRDPDGYLITVHDGG